jgi:hypothetical protein
MIMAWDMKFSPETRDLIRDSRGSVETTQTAATMVMHQLDIHYRKWAAAPEIGSMIHDLKSFGNRPEVAVPAEYRRALGVVEARGRIDNVSVDSDAPNQGRVNIAAEFRDVRSGRILKTGA